GENSDGTNRRVVLRVGCCVVVDNGAHRSRSDPVAKESGFRFGGASDGRLHAEDHLSPFSAERARAGDRLRDADGADRDVKRSVSFISWTGHSTTARVLGESGGGWCADACDLSVADGLSRSRNGADAPLVELSWRWIAGCTRSADEEAID